MARPASERVGRGTCPEVGCGAAVTYRKSSGGMLTHRCDACESSGYAEPGGAAYQRRMATVKGNEPEPAPKPEPVATKRPAPTPNPAKTSSIFHMGL